KRDVAGIEELFTSDALINSPISGTTGVKEFHEYLFHISVKLIAKLNVEHHRRNSNTIALPFNYTFSLPNGGVAILDGVAHFELEPGLQKFRKMTVVYDASDLRQLLDKSGIEPLVSALNER
ncbi:MAG TPA: nuclear transport factor 2 family protein, partial [Burkholderiaceae bacterium]|nr:nuclear transport factor 2 family protein [Burkholderiaceae bacterium]